MMIVMMNCFRGMVDNERRSALFPLILKILTIINTSKGVYPAGHHPRRITKAEKDFVK